jgi:hypothetical protein
VIAMSIFPPAMSRMTSIVWRTTQKALMVSGLILIIGLAGLLTGHSAVVDGLKKMLGDDSALIANNFSVDEAETLSPKMLIALDYVARRYRVSDEALHPIFATAQSAARELRLDPLLIIAVIGIESRFNPFSQSVVGAQGLMQVMPRYHQDKLPEDAGELPFIDPMTNVQVGAKVLKESIRRFGSLEAGLQQFGGALNDPERRYSTKVIAELQRLEQAVQQGVRTAKSRESLSDA